jgi:hypothetical protein
MAFGWDWNKGLANYFEYLTTTIELTLTHFGGRLRHRDTSYYPFIDIQKLTEKLHNGELNTGDFIGVRGIYSEFIPILNLSLLFPGFTPLRPANKYTMHLRVPLIDVPEFSLPLRLKPLLGIGIAGLFNKSSKGVYDACVPVFYDSRLFKVQKETTGHVVEIRAKIINIPKRWSKLFLNHEIFRYMVKDLKSNRCVGLLIDKFKEYDAVDRFFADFWRLDYFPFKNYDEDYYEFRQIKSDFKDWPNTSQKIMNYLSLLQLEGIRQNKIMSFGILPRINLTNSNKVQAKRTHLRNFYLYAIKKSKPSDMTSLPITVGHGAFKLNNYKKAVTVFQYDQVKSVLSQEFNFKADISQYK